MNSFLGDQSQNVIENKGPRPGTAHRWTDVVRAFRALSRERPAPAHGQDARATAGRMPAPQFLAQRSEGCGLWQCRSMMPSHETAWRVFFGDQSQNLIENKGLLLEAWGRGPGLNTDRDGKAFKDKTIDALTGADYDYAIAGPLVALLRSATRLDVEIYNGCNS